MSENTGQGKGENDTPSSIEQYLVKDPDLFALNIARMIEQAGKAASAWIEPREGGQARHHMAEPMADMVKTFSQLSQYWLSDPQRTLEAQTRLLGSYMDIWMRAIQRLNTPMDSDQPEEAIKSQRKDKRFQDPEWERNAFFDLLKQTYLVTSKWAADLVEQTQGLDEHTRQKAEFYVKQVSAALSPSNFLFTNPELLRETMAAHGDNLVRGMKMLAQDIAAGKGELKLRQVDDTQFAIGENIAISPGKVVGRSDMAEIIQYAPSTQKVLKRPLLICPPWINKFYILDLNPEKSFIRWATAQGHTVFVISWVNPDERHATKGWEAYIREGLQFGLDTIEKATGETRVNAIGYCVGGTLLASALALMAQEGDERICSATFFAAQVDFTYAGDLKVFVDEDQIQALEAAMQDKGYLEGSRMATAFNMLRSNDLIWPYVVNNYMRGKDPMPFDLLYWNSDSTRMTAANHSFYLRNCYLENNLARAQMQLAGRTLSLADIKVPIYMLAAKQDHIAPALSVFTGCQFFGGDVEYVMSGSGHIAGVINPPQSGKYQYWTGNKPVGDFDQWVEKAKETPGSWWPHWQKWIKSQDNKRVAARKPGQKTQPLDDAPGAYVRIIV
ncbi:PHA/PHB synthase family protein [Aquamicrobium segne]|uniref:PHA/PHB synthase family protein n=1 Tax=Aquamicrobium segne TaxID=469547 RepID=A0ABW0GYY1_9HYPH